jgi:hypothetical protein
VRKQTAIKTKVWVLKILNCTVGGEEEGGIGLLIKGGEGGAKGGTKVVCTGCTGIGILGNIVAILFYSLFCFCFIILFISAVVLILEPALLDSCAFILSMSRLFCWAIEKVKIERAKIQILIRIHTINNPSDKFIIYY